MGKSTIAVELAQRMSRSGAWSQSLYVNLRGVINSDVVVSWGLSTSCWAATFVWYDSHGSSCPAVVVRTGVCVRICVYGTAIVALGLWLLLCKHVEG